MAACRMWPFYRIIEHNIPEGRRAFFGILWVDTQVVDNTALNQPLDHSV